MFFQKKKKLTIGVAYNYLFLLLVISIYWTLDMMKIHIEIIGFYCIHENQLLNNKSSSSIGIHTPDMYFHAHIRFFTLNESELYPYYLDPVAFLQKNASFLWI